MQAFEVICCC